MDYYLKKGEVISVNAASSHFLRVADGCIWLTRPDDPRDYFLRRGGRFDVGAGGTFVLEALADAVVGVECPSKSMLQLTIRVNACIAGNALLLARRTPNGC